MTNPPEGFKFREGIGWYSILPDGSLNQLGAGKWVRTGDRTAFEWAEKPDEVPQELIAELDALAPRLTRLQRDLLFFMRRANQRGEHVRPWALAEALKALGHARATEHSVQLLQSRLRREILPPRLWVLFAPPVEVTPGAKSGLWEEILHRAMPDPEVRGYFQRIVGYSLSGDTSEDAVFFIHGPAATGKSSILQAIRMAMGDYARVVSYDTYLTRRSDAGSPRPDIARLKGARLAATFEIAEGREFDAGLIKTISGGDPVIARHLYRERTTRCSGSSRR